MYTKAYKRALIAKYIAAGGKVTKVKENKGGKVKKIAHK